MAYLSTFVQFALIRNKKKKGEKTNYLGFILFSRKNDFPLMQKDTSFK